MKVKNGNRSKFFNLSSWKERGWKKSGLQWDSNLWPLRYWCDAGGYYLYIETRVSSLICRHSKGLLLETLKFVYILLKPVIKSNNQFQEQCEFMMLIDEKRPIFLG